jgi:hypothetical protein
MEEVLPSTSSIRDYYLPPGLLDQHVFLGHPFDEHNLSHKYLKISLKIWML